MFLPTNASNEVAVAMRNANGGASACSYSVHQAKALLQTPYLVPSVRNSVYAEAYQLASVTGASAQRAMFTTPQKIDSDPQPNEKLRTAYENVALRCLDHGLNAIEKDVFAKKSAVPTMRGALQVAMQATQQQQQKLLLLCRRAQRAANTLHCLQNMRLLSTHSSIWEPQRLANCRM